MGKRTGASRKMLNLGNEKLETKEYFIKTPESANDPWSNENIDKNRERYKKNPIKFVEEINNKKLNYHEILPIVE
jgi:hypothetical protein